MKPVSPQLLLAVSLGGVMGSLARYATGLAAPERVGAVPWSTLAVNVLGCGLLGLLAGALERHPRPLLRAFLGTGVLGGFTTFSAFECGLRAQAASGRDGLFAAYLLLSLVLGLLACIVGLRAGRLVPLRSPR